LAELHKTKEEASAFQNMMLGLDALHSMGNNGQGISIAVMDGGFIGVNSISFFNHLYMNAQVLETLDFVTGGSDVYKYTDHGTRVLGLMAAYEPDSYVGGAPGAGYHLYVTEDDCGTCEHRVEEYNWVFAAEKADSAGVDIINTSLGYNLFEDPTMDYAYEDLDGFTAIISQAASTAASKGIVVVTAAGNEGNLPWKYVTAPADAIGILSVGNVRSSGDRSSSSSIGPAIDGRIKPEVAALGSGVKVINGSGLIATSSGTSFSAPQVTSLAAALWQAYPTFSSTELISLIKQSGTNSDTPDNEIGYGIPNARTVINLISVADASSPYTVYPNPIMNNQLVIRSNNPTINSDVDLSVYSAKGEAILRHSLRFSWSELTQTLDLTGYPAGLYILNLVSGTHLEKIRVVKHN